MITVEQLVDGFGLNLRLIHMQTDGLSHADSLVQTPHNINCLNWVLGHIAVNRDNVLRLIRGEPTLSNFAHQRYGTGSDPIKQDGEDVVNLEQLLELLDEGQARISEAAGMLSAEDMEKEIPVGDIKMPVINRIFGFYFHDTYHTGQTDLLRQVAGMNDNVV